MSDNEIVSIISNIVGESDTTIVLAYYLQAKGIVLNKVFPYDSTVDEIPTRYLGNTIEIASYLYNKRGAEGETAHNENGISRTYGGASVPDDMLKPLIAYVGVV